MTNHSWLINLLQQGLLRARYRASCSRSRAKQEGPCIQWPPVATCCLSRSWDGMQILGSLRTSSTETHGIQKLMGSRRNALATVCSLSTASVIRDMAQVSFKCSCRPTESRERKKKHMVTDIPRITTSSFLEIPNLCCSLNRTLSPGFKRW